MISIWGAKLRKNDGIAARLPFFNFFRAVALTLHTVGNTSGKAIVKKIIWYFLLFCP